MRGSKVEYDKQNYRLLAGASSAVVTTKKAA
jgi:hypothetical protein